MKKVIIPILFTWIGMVLAISFMEAPLKFQAPGITIPLGVGIGRIVFHALNKIELCFAFLLLLFFVLDLKNTKAPWLAVVPLLLILLAETFYLLPVLDARAELVIAGKSVPESSHHLLYINAEGLKVILLACIGVITLKSMKA